MDCYKGLRISYIRRESHFEISESKKGRPWGATFFN